MEEWKECRLGDYCDFQNGYAFKSSEFKTNGEYKIVKIKELKDGLVKFFDDSASVDIQGVKEFEKYKIYRNDVLFALTGDPVSKPNPLSWVGRVSIYRSDENALLNQRTCKIKKSERIDNKFLYYYFRQWENFYALASKATGSASQANISTNTIADTIIKLPPLPTQQKITRILSSLDDKIELNNKINTNLEQQAGALFKNWFVDFEPFGGKMPEGWKVGTIGDLCSTISKTYKGNDSHVVLINTSDVENGTILNHNSVPNSKLKGQFKKTFQKGDILYSEIRPANKHYAFVDIETTSNYIASTKLMVIRPNEGINPHYLYHILTNPDLIQEMQHLAETCSGTFSQITFESELSTYQIPLLPKEEQDKLGELFEKIDNQIFHNIEENKQLSTIRDTLLPKLMSSELDVKFVKI